MLGRWWYCRNPSQGGGIWLCPEDRLSVSRQRSRACGVTEERHTPNDNQTSPSPPPPKKKIMGISGRERGYHLSQTPKLDLDIVGKLREQRLDGSSRKLTSWFWHTLRLSRSLEKSFDNLYTHSGVLDSSWLRKFTSSSNLKPLGFRFSSCLFVNECMWRMVRG